VIVHMYIRQESRRHVFAPSVKTESQRSDTGQTKGMLLKPRNRRSDGLSIIDA